MAEKFNAGVVDSTVALLRTGDILLRRGRGPDSYILAHLNLKDQSWSHCGIVVMEHGYPFVYHSIGGEDNPDQRLRRDSAAFFCSAINNYGTAIVRYQFTPAHIADLVSVVHHYYAARPKFDLHFDLRTDDELYCSEFVYKALNAATHDTGFIPISHGHQRDFVGIDDLFMNRHAAIIRMAYYQ